MPKVAPDWYAGAASGTALSFGGVETATSTAYHNLLEEVINTMLSTNHWIQGKLPQK